MKITLAGYNVDAEALEVALDKAAHADDHEVDFSALTPETISAAYARISRSPDPVDVLRRKAREDVVKARVSNEKIVFGLGHGSIAEHAMFNFDIQGVSRRAVEEIEAARIGVGYTERSQRYLKITQDELVTPEEFQHWHRQQYHDLFGAQMELYQKLLKAGVPGEDARYCTCLGMEAQLGMSINGRALNKMIRRLYATKMVECAQIADGLKEAAQEIAPSLVRHCDEEDVSAMRQLGRFPIPELHAKTKWSEGIDHDAGERKKSVLSTADTHVLAALMFAVGRATFDDCVACVKMMGYQRASAVFDALYKQLKVHDSLPRAFEMPDVAVQVSVSASCFAQMKRHRIGVTLIPQGYDPYIEPVVPDTFDGSDAVAELCKLADHSARLYRQLVSEGIPTNVAEYALLQCHQRRVLVKMNARELYAFARLRCDAHAQHEIRHFADRLIEYAKEEMSLTLKMACGKDKFTP